MESVFRLLLHELSLIQGDCPDLKLLVSIDYHKRDLARTLETAKWKLEDFESFFCENKLRRFCSRTNVLGFMNNIRTVYGSRVTRNYTKRFKDGEQSHSPSCHVLLMFLMRHRYTGVLACLGTFILLPTSYNLCVQGFSQDFLTVGITFFVII